jgi:hypothetical protein
MDSAVLLRASIALIFVAEVTSVPAADDPTDPAAPAATDRFRSTFTDYHRYQEPARPPWRRTIQEVAPQAHFEDEHAGHEGHTDQQRAAPATPAADSIDHSHHHHQ